MEGREEEKGRERRGEKCRVKGGKGGERERKEGRGRERKGKGEKWGRKIGNGREEGMELERRAMEGRGGGRESKCVAK